jgi:hypothetical protein
MLVPENACAERRRADFGGYPVAFVTFCVDGMKFALRFQAKRILLVDGVLGKWFGGLWGVQRQL